MSRFIRLLCLPALCVVAAVVVLLLRARRPRDAEAYFERGTALLNASQYAEACEKYARAVEIDERFGDAYFNWGVALARMGKRAEADEEWKKAAELNPHSRGIRARPADRESCEVEELMQPEACRRRLPASTRSAPCDPQRPTAAAGAPWVPSRPGPM